MTSLWVSTTMAERCSSSAAASAVADAEPDAAGAALAAPESAFVEGEGNAIAATGVKGAVERADAVAGGPGDFVGAQAASVIAHTQLRPLFPMSREYLALPRDCKSPATGRPTCLAFPASPLPGYCASGQTMAVPVVTGPHVRTGGQVPLSFVTQTYVLMGRMTAGEADPAAATMGLKGQQI